MKRKTKTNQQRSGRIHDDEFTEEQWDLHAEFSYLTKLATAALGEDELLVRQMRIESGRVDEGGCAYQDFATLAALRAQLFRLPMQQLAKVFNGWTPDQQPLSRSQWKKMNAFQLHRAMSLTIRHGARPTPSIYAERLDELNDYPCPVRVVIREGTSKAETIITLLRMLAFLDCDWPRLVANLDDFTTHEIPPSALEQ